MDARTEAIANETQALLWAHEQLVSYELCWWSQGNVSVAMPEYDLMLIKPSGVRYEDLQWMAEVRLSDGAWLSDLKPSTDAEDHRAIYNGLMIEEQQGILPNSEKIRSIVHTHSAYATAFAARSLPIRCCLTEIADEFGGDIPCAPYSRIGSTEMAQAFFNECSRKATFYRAMLLAQHGVLALGADIIAAVKAAVLVEHAAKTMHLSEVLPYEFGRPLTRLPDAEIAAAHDRYSNDYGQDK